MPQAQLILDYLRRHGDHPSGFIALEPDNEYYLDEELEGFVAYRRAGRYRFVFSGPVGDAAREARIFDRFLAETARAGQRVVAVQVPEQFLNLYAERGFVLNQLGMTYVVDLSQATLDGSAMRKVRQGVRRGERAGGKVLEVGVDIAWTDELNAQLDAVDAKWLGPSGKSAKALQFMVGTRSSHLREQRRLFVVELDGRIVGYSQCAPAFGSRPGWLYDLNRLGPGSPDVGDLQFWSVAKRLQEEDVGWFHLGFTPFAELDELRHTPAVRSSRAGGYALQMLAKHGEPLYPTRGAVAWKRKWKPVTAKPEYVAFPGRLRLGAVVRLLKLTNVV
jgi:lysylphosphatidylglycerol synthetase-like protein (DUF2156 family)